VYKNLVMLKEQSFGMCAKCQSNNKCSMVDENNRVYCGICGLQTMGIPEDTPLNQEALNKAVAIRDSGIPPEQFDDPVIPSEVVVPPKSGGMTAFYLKELDTGFLLTYKGQEHYLTSKSAVLKHLGKNVL